MESIPIPERAEAHDPMKTEPANSKLEVQDSASPITPQPVTRPSESGHTQAHATKGPPSASVGPDPIETEARLIELQSQCTELLDQQIRLKADCENYKKRLLSQMESAKRYTLENYFKGLLPVVDCLEQAVHAAKPTGERADGALLQGVQATLKLLHNLLASDGVRPIEETNTPFDPEQHHVMRVEATADVQPGGVIRVFQKGYVFHDRLLRPAMVSVAKAPEETEAPGVPQQADQQGGSGKPH